MGGRMSKKKAYETFKVHAEEREGSVASNVSESPIVEGQGKQSSSQREIAAVMEKFDLPKATVEEMHSTFLRFAKKNANGLTIEEFENMSLLAYEDQEMRARIKREGHFRNAVARFDLNGNGFMEFEEFVNMVVNPDSNKDPKERLDKYFAALMEQFDVNKDGKISKEELTAVLNREVPFSPYKEDKIKSTVEKVFRLVDTNKNGKLSSEEIMESLEKDYTVLMDVLMLSMVK